MSVLCKAVPTEIRIAGLAELSPSTKTEIKRQLVSLAQLASTLDGCESILGVVISHKPIVVPVTDDKRISLYSFSLCRRSSSGHNRFMLY